MKKARLVAISRVKTKARPKTSGMLAVFSASSLMPAARCQGLAKRTGEYQRPPSTKAETAAAMTANQLTMGMMRSP